MYQAFVSITNHEVLSWASHLPNFCQRISSFNDQVMVWNRADAPQQIMLPTTREVTATCSWCSLMWGRMSLTHRGTSTNRPTKWKKPRNIGFVLPSQYIFIYKGACPLLIDGLNTKQWKWSWTYQREHAPVVFPFGCRHTRERHFLPPASTLTYESPTDGFTRSSVNISFQEGQT